MSWDAADVRMIIDEVGRWRARALDPQVSNWAQCMTAPVLSGLMAQLTEIGVLSEEMGLDPDVPGLWRDLTDPQAIARRGTLADQFREPERVGAGQRRAGAGLPPACAGPMVAEPDARALGGGPAA